MEGLRNLQKKTIWEVFGDLQKKNWAMGSHYIFLSIAIWTIWSADSLESVAIASACSLY